MRSPGPVVAGFLFSLVLQGLLSAAVAQQYVAHRPSILLLGDSLTEFGWGNHWKYHTDKKGWAALLAEAYSRKADVINRGLSGYNTRWALQALPQILEDLGCSSSSVGGQQRGRGMRQSLMSWLASGQGQQQQGGQRCRVGLMTIFFGANDAVEPGSRQHVPLAEYKDNLIAMVTAARQAGVQNVLLITPPPIDEAAWAKEQGTKTSDRTNARTQQYATAVREVGAKLGVPVLDLQAAINAQGPQALKQLLIDGVHFSPEGEQLVFKSLMGLIDSDAQLSGVRAPALPYHLPLYNQVDAADPSKTFKELFKHKD